MKRLAIVATLALTGCTTSGLVDHAMQAAKTPPSHRSMRVGERLVLAGDLHCHVLPPDAPWHVTRELPRTFALATEQDLDFVVLTPHVPSRFFMEEDTRRWVVKTQTDLRARIEALHPTFLVIPGFEYTDPRFGHVGMGFADVADVLAEVGTEEAIARPALFFERWLAHGGLMTINHPLQGPIPKSVFDPLRWNLTWRGFQKRPVPQEIAFVTTHAQAVETFNTSITHLRDQYILGDEERTLRMASSLVDREAKRQHRRISQVGGTDSHGDWLRPTTYVLAKERTKAAIRDAITEGRTCVRAPEACSLEVQGDDGVWHGIGEDVRASRTVRARMVTSGTFLLDGGVAAQGTEVTLPVSAEHCSIVRGIAGLGWSSGVYVNCN